MLALPGHRARPSSRRLTPGGPPARLCELRNIASAVRDVPQFAECTGRQSSSPGVRPPRLGSGAFDFPVRERGARYLVRTPRVGVAPAPARARAPGHAGVCAQGHRHRVSPAGAVAERRRRRAWFDVRMALNITGDAPADALLTDDPFALLVGMLLDQ